MGERLGRWAKEIRLAGRALTRSPVFFGVAVLTLGLGLGGGTAIFTLLDRVVLDPLPYPESDRLVRLKNVVPCVAPGTEWDMATGQFVYFGQEARTLEAIGAYRGFGANVQTPGGAYRARGATVSASLMELIDARAHLGRVVGPEEDRPGGAPVVVLSDGFWRRSFGADEDVVGRTLTADGTSLEVIGVMEPDVRLPQEPGTPAGARTELWIPMGIDPAGPHYNSHVIPMIARMAPEATLEGARADLARMTADLPEEIPNAYSRGFIDECGFRAVAYDLKEHVVGDMARNLWIVFGAVGLVLFIACANVANLFLVRMEERRRELTIRAALGAGRGAILRYLAAEAMVLAGLGGLLALAVGRWGVPLLVAMAPDTLPRLGDVSAGGASALFTAAATLGVTAVLVLFPYLQLSSDDLGGGLPSGGRASSDGRSRQRIRSTLVVAQVALASILVVGAGLLVQTVRQFQRADPGVDAEGVLTAELYLSGESYDTEGARWAFYDRLIERLEGIPGVEAAGLGSELPVAGRYGCTVQGFGDERVYERIQDAESTTCAGQTIVTPGYFEALGIPVLQGRTFVDGDNDDPTRGAVVVSRAFARRFWPDEDPLGKEVAPNGDTDGPFFRVVGVVGDVKAETVHGDDAVAVYYPVVRLPGYGGSWYRPGTLVVKSAGMEPTSLLAPVQRVVRELDSTIPVANAREMTEVVRASMSRVTFTALLLEVAAATALFLAALGLYGVIAYVVSRRTREIGMRLAIGAQPGQVVGMIVRKALTLAGLGLAAGLAVALVTSRVVEGLLFGVSPTHPPTFVGTAALLVAIAGLAAWLPARRAARVDPFEALRSE